LSIKFGAYSGNVGKIRSTVHKTQEKTRLAGKYANIATDVGVDDKTIKEYFLILEDTMIGFFLEPFKNSFRKRLVEKPKFYFFDPGVVRSLCRRLSVPLTPKTSAYGNAFEHFILLEFIRLGNYFQPDYRFSFIRTTSDVEVDLVVERPGKPGKLQEDF
jgi:predicted AAA+ superfamily ATPase